MFEFLEFLIYLPLAIIQAVLYINVTTTSVFQYIHFLKNIPGDITKLLEIKWENDSRDPKQTHVIINIWAVLFEQIRKNLGIAKLFNFIAYIKFKIIPPLILLLIRLKSEQNMAFGVFCGYLFLTKQGNNTTYNIYYLVHFVLLIWVKRQKNAREQRQDMLVYFQNIFLINKWEKREKQRQILPHILETIRFNGGNKNNWYKKSNLKYQAGKYLTVDG